MLSRNIRLELVGCVDFFSVDRKNYIGFLNSGCFRGTPGNQPLDEHTLGFLQADCLGIRVVDGADLDADVTAPHLSILDNIFSDVTGKIDRNCEPVPLISGVCRRDRRVDPNDLPVEVYERTAAVARFDRGVCLDEVFDSVVIAYNANVAAERAYNSRRHRSLQVER